MWVGVTSAVYPLIRIIAPLRSLLQGSTSLYRLRRGRPGGSNTYPGGSTGHLRTHSLAPRPGVGLRSRR